MANADQVDHTRRFTSRAAYYAAYRPVYPDAVIECLRRDAALPASAVVVDVGSGTGLSAELFLRHGYTVFGIEPNDEMRAAAEAHLRQYPAFHSIDARAEQTTRPDASADVIVSASAFHWFDAVPTRAEFRRILKPHGLEVVMSNGRRKDSSRFMRDYAAIIRRYQEHTPAHEHKEERVRAFFAPREVHRASIDYRESLDFAALAGRTLSYSTMPLEGQPGHEAMMRELRDVFDRFAVDGRVQHDSRVTLHWARPA